MKARCTMSKLQENEMLNILKVSELDLKKKKKKECVKTMHLNYVPMLQFYEQPTLKEKMCIREAMKSPSLEISRPQLDKSLHSLIYAGWALSIDWTRWPP